MIITRPRGAIVSNPARRTGAERDPITLRHRARLEESRPHLVELYTRGGRRFARLYGEDRQALEERAARWPQALGLELNHRFTPGNG